MCHERTFKSLAIANEKPRDVARGFESLGGSYISTSRLLDHTQVNGF